MNHTARGASTIHPASRHYSLFKSILEMDKYNYVVNGDGRITDKEEQIVLAK